MYFALPAVSARTFSIRLFFFIKNLFYAANTFYDTSKRESLTLVEEQIINETAKCRIIGLTLETRPDSITPEEIKRFRYYGCTRVQLGIQHIDDKILKKINRGCYTKDTIRALYLLKQNGFKIDIHLMPDLYGSSYDKDKKMFDTLQSVKKHKKNSFLKNFLSLYFIISLPKIFIISAFEIFFNSILIFIKSYFLQDRESSLIKSPFPSRHGLFFTECSVRVLGHKQKPS